MSDIFLAGKKGKKETFLARDMPFWQKSWLGKALEVKILAGYCTLKSSSSWLWGADIILPEKLIINQKTISDC